MGVFGAGETFDGAVGVEHARHSPHLDCVYIGCMPRMQVYLSDDLYDVVKSQGLSPSRLLQDAVRDHCQRQEKIAEARAYVQEIYEQLGPPTEEDNVWAETLTRQILGSLRADELSDAEPLADSPKS